MRNGKMDLSLSLLCVLVAMADGAAGVAQRGGEVMSHRQPESSLPVSRQQVQQEVARQEAYLQLLKQLDNTIQQVDLFSEREQQHQRETKQQQDQDVGEVQAADDTTSESERRSDTEDADDDSWYYAVWDQPSSNYKSPAASSTAAAIPHHPDERVPLKHESEDATAGAALAEKGSGLIESGSWWMKHYYRYSRYFWPEADYSSHPAEESKKTVATAAAAAQFSRSYYSITLFDDDESSYTDDPEGLYAAQDAAREGEEAVQEAVKSAAAGGTASIAVYDIAGWSSYTDDPKEEEEEDTETAPLVGMVGTSVSSMLSSGTPKGETTEGGAAAAPSIKFSRRRHLRGSFRPV